MPRTESTEDRARRVGIPVILTLVILAPVIHVTNELTGVNAVVSTFPGDATLLIWSVITLAVAAWITHGVAQVLLSGLVLLSTPVLIGRLYHATGVTFGMNSSNEAVFVTCAGIGIVLSMGLAGRGLPLVSKELQEQSSRRRTFVLRVVYAILAFLAAFSFSFDTLHRTWETPFAILGKGQELFSFFVLLQFFGIYLFMPALCCNLITSEKERDTLSLLFLTRLSPWGILIGKFLSRFLAMLLFLALSLPLFGYAYSLGGFETEQIWCAAWVLFVASLQVGSFALLCSCWFRRTVGAFIASYVFGFVMIFGPMMFNAWTGFFSRLGADLADLFQNSTILGFESRQIEMLFFAPGVLWPNGPMSGGGDFLTTVLRTIPILCLCGFLFLASRLVVVRRANAPPRNLLLSLFRLLDRTFWTLNEEFGRGVVLTRDTKRLPEARPIAWRETNHRTLGTTRYLIRIFIAMEFPIIFICALSVGSGRGGIGVLNVLMIIVWIVVVLLVCGASTSLISAERSGQTFDTLLTTPMTNREILNQKFVGIRRLLFVLAVPLLTIYGFEIMLRYDVPGLFRSRGVGRFEMTMCYAVTGITTVLIYLPMISWLSFWIGLKLPSQSKAIIVSVGTLVGWCGIPLLILMPFDVAYDVLNPGREWPLLVSPAMIIPINEFGDAHHPWFSFFLNSAVYGAILLALRSWCLLRSASLLGRTDTR